MYPITISREFGSGGHSIGKQVAEELNIPFYDGEIVERVATQKGFTKEIIDRHGESVFGASKWFDVAAASAAYYQSPQDEIFLAQRKVVLECVKEGPCVIVGRCSDYILKAMDIPALHILIHADMPFRKKRVLERYGEVEHVDIEKRILKKDKQRRAYYKYYTDQTWGTYTNYDLALDSGTMGEDLCVHLICELANTPDLFVSNRA